jgi:ADP-ribose pyrophosphatase
MIKPWKQLSHSVPFKNPYWEYHLDKVKLPDGREGEYHFAVNRNAISVFVQLEDGRFVMLREYRYTVGKVSLSHVQGGIEEGETPEACARREIVEEVGYEAGEMIHLGKFATAPAFASEEVDVYLARNIKEVGKKKLDHELEFTETVVMSEAEIDAAIASGEIWDGQVLAPWTLLKQYLQKTR